eukprot:SM000010S04259  [mRNA]  locus=s10:658240:659671:+ [translate_table: standard]
MAVGAVGALRRVKGAIQAAELVLRHSSHTLLVGEQAADFALAMGCDGPSDLTTDRSAGLWSAWTTQDCQPNFWKDVEPDHSSQCGPYAPKTGAPSGDLAAEQQESRGVHRNVGPGNHDTISMVAIDENGSMAAGGSTNGLTFKIPGRVGDTPIPGAGVYVDSDVGGCGATGDGDIMMRFLACYQVVESMRQGQTPLEAAEDAIARIVRKHPHFVGALFAVNKLGDHAGACNGWEFQYSVKTSLSEIVEIHTVLPSAKASVR